MGKIAGLVLIAAGVGIAANSVSSGPGETSLTQASSQSSRTQAASSTQATSKIDSTSSPVLPDGTRVLPDGTRVLPDDTRSAGTYGTAAPALTINAQRKPRSFSAGKSLLAKNALEIVSPTAETETKLEPAKSKPERREQQFTSYLSRLLPWRNSPITPNAPVVTASNSNPAPTPKPPAVRQLPSGSTTLSFASAPAREDASRQDIASNSIERRPARNVVTTLQAPGGAFRVPNPFASNASSGPAIKQLVQTSPATDITRPGDEAARIAVTRNLQRQLRRVGCYDGAIDGTWDDASQRAMSEFTRRVNATLPVDQPDYILLTLVQGHFDKACSNSVHAQADAVDAEDAVDALDSEESDLPPLPTRVVRSQSRPERLAPRRPREVASVITPALLKARRLARANAKGKAGGPIAAPIPIRNPAVKRRAASRRLDPGRAHIAVRTSPIKVTADMAQQVASRISNNSAVVTIRQHAPVAPPSANTIPAAFEQPVPKNWRTHKWATLPRPSKRSFIQTPSITPGSHTTLAAVATPPIVRTPQGPTPERVAPIDEAALLAAIDQKAEREAAAEEAAREQNEATKEEETRDERHNAARQAAREERLTAARQTAREERRAEKRAARERRSNRRRVARAGRYKPKYNLGASNRKAERRRSRKSRRKARRKAWRRNFFENQQLNSN